MGFLPNSELSSLLQLVCTAECTSGKWLVLCQFVFRMILILHGCPYVHKGSHKGSSLSQSRQQSVAVVKAE